jgi:hypothetical protein
MPQTWNRYSYVLNNPLKYIDEKGEDITLVVRAPGDGATNFGHVAVRVHGKGYDRTYDFGRYRGTWGFMKSKGEGILRVWGNYKAFMAGQEKKGDVQTVTWQTSGKTDQAVMGFFNEKIANGDKIATTSSYTSYKLDDNYSLLSNNCTTITMDGIAAGAAVPGVQLDGFSTVRDENDPGDVYDGVVEMKKKEEDEKLKKDQ